MCVFRQSGLHQVLGASIGAFPLSPQNAAQFVPDPAIQLFQRLPGFGQPKVGHPAAKDRVEFGDDCGQAAPSRSFEHFVDSAFQPFQAGRRNPQSWGFVPREAVAQKLPLPRTLDCTLGRIDRELERVRQKPGDARHDPFPCLLASDVDVAVVGVAAEGVAPAFQFPIQLRQQDVR